MSFVELGPKHKIFGFEWGGRKPIRSLEPDKDIVYLHVDKTGNDFYGRYAKVTPDGKQVSVHSFSANTDIEIRRVPLNKLDTEPDLSHKVAYIPGR